jgi:hypothetical protein
VTPAVGEAEQVRRDLAARVEIPGGHVPRLSCGGRYTVRARSRRSRTATSVFRAMSASAARSAAAAS